MPGWAVSSTAMKASTAAMSTSLLSFLDRPVWIIHSAISTQYSMRSNLPDSESMACTYLWLGWVGWVRWSTR